MPHYEFFCHACNRPFSNKLPPIEHNEGKVVNPRCGSEEVEQRWFYLVAKQSAQATRQVPTGSCALPFSKENREDALEDEVTEHFAQRHSETRALAQDMVPAGQYGPSLQDGGPYASKEITRIPRQSRHPLCDHLPPGCLHREGNRSADTHLK